MRFGAWKLLTMKTTRTTTPGSKQIPCSEACLFFSSAALKVLSRGTLTIKYVLCNFRFGYFEWFTCRGLGESLTENRASEFPVTFLAPSSLYDVPFFVPVAFDRLIKKTF